jgi:hypothetical protein
MNKQKSSLIWAVLFLGLLAASIVASVVKSSWPLYRMAVNVGLLLIGISHLIRFRSPESQLVRPIRIAGVLAWIGGFFMKGHL